MKKEHTFLFIYAFFLGLVGVLSAHVFIFLLNHVQWLFLERLAHYQMGTVPSKINWFILISTTLGGLISGILVYSLAPEAEGHGTDAAIKAFHQTGGRIRARVPFVKILASAVTIGSGGSAGREGPVVQISSGLASIFAQITKLPVPERRLLLLIGMAAGLAAVFRSPIGAAIFAVGILYSEVDIEAHAVLFCLFASVTAYAINGVLVGWEPLFKIPGKIAVTELRQYLYFLSLGISSGLVASVLPQVFYGTRDFFRRLKIPNWIKPAIGGLGVGLMALVFPQVLGGGYHWIQMAIDGKLALTLMLVLILAKMIALSLTVGSGGSGGVFAPSLFIGAMVGGTLAHFFHQAPAPYVVVGMCSVFGAAARVPLASLFMVIEMTGAFHILAAAALSVTVSYVIQRFLSGGFKYRSLYEGQVPTKFESPAHRGEFFYDILSGIKVGDIFDPHRKEWSVIPETLPFRDFISLYERTGQHYFPVVDKEQKLVGIFSSNDIRPYLSERHLWDLLLIRDIARRDVITTHPSEDIHTLLRKFIIRNIEELPVVDEKDPQKFLGFISRREVIAFYNKRLSQFAQERS